MLCHNITGSYLWAYYCLCATVLDLCLLVNLSSMFQFHVKLLNYFPSSQQSHSRSEKNIGHMKKLLVVNNVIFYSCQTEMPVPVSWINGQTDNT